MRMCSKITISALAFGAALACSQAFAAEPAGGYFGGPGSTNFNATAHEWEMVDPTLGGAQNNSMFGPVSPGERPIFNFVAPWQPPQAAPQIKRHHKVSLRRGHKAVQ